MSKQANYGFLLAAAGRELLYIFASPVGPDSVSLASPQAGKLRHSAVHPFQASGIMPSVQVLISSVAA